MAKVMVTKTCPFCNKQFSTTRGNKKFCSDACNLKSQIAARKSVFHETKKVDKADKADKGEKKERKKKRKIDPLTEIAIEARNAGMSYGRYVAFKEGRIKIETN